MTLIRLFGRGQDRSGLMFLNKSSLVGSRERRVINDMTVWAFHVKLRNHYFYISVSPIIQSRCPAPYRTPPPIDNCWHWRSSKLAVCTGKKLGSARLLPASFVQNVKTCHTNGYWLATLLISSVPWRVQCVSSAVNGQNSTGADYCVKVSEAFTLLPSIFPPYVFLMPQFSTRFDKS